MVPRRTDDAGQGAGNDPLLVDLAREALELAGRVSVRLAHRPARPVKPGDDEGTRS